MNEGRSLFQTVILYVQLAFPNDPNMLKLFGQSQYNSARASHLKLPVLLRTMFTQASKPEYKTALITKGLTESQINMLETLATGIVNQNVVQEKAKKRAFTVCQRSYRRDECRLGKNVAGLYVCQNGVSERCRPVQPVPAHRRRSVKIK